MAIEPRQIAGMVEKGMGAGGDLTPEEDSLMQGAADSLQIQVDETEVLPEGIELDTGEQVEVMAEEYNHDANLAEVLEE